MHTRVGIFLLIAAFASAQVTPRAKSADNVSILGFQNSAAQLTLDREFLKIPDAALAGQELKILTAAPHIAGSKEDYATALYVAGKFREAGLETKIVPYRIMMNLPEKIQVTGFDAEGKQIMTGPFPEHVSDDPYQDDKRISTAFNGYSPSGDVNAEVVYANYGRPEDFAALASKQIDVRGKIVIVRYGDNFRGIKAYLAEKYGAAGVIIYSDPADDGYFRGDVYPIGPFRPESGVQRGSIQYLIKYPGDPTTPGFASTPDLPASKRVPLKEAINQPKIPTTPLSYKDAAPILKALGGPVTPRSWQGALPFTYHLGPGPVKVHMVLKQKYALHTIWNVIGKIPGTQYPDDWVIVGNHRDAWVFGAFDPGSGTAAMLEAVHGVGALLKQGWKPKRTLMFASWDAEEEGTIGSTEWGEQYGAPLAHAVAYFNIDVGVSGPKFGAGSVPSLKPFVVAITKLVPSPQGGTVYDAWLRDQRKAAAKQKDCDVDADNPGQKPVLIDGIHMGNVGGGSDYTVFLDHLGVPSNYISSGGPSGVYHSAFDNYAWFTKFADPKFVYLQQQARVLGLEAITMADADLLPYDYAVYGEEIRNYLRTAEARAEKSGMHNLDFQAALDAATRFRDAGNAALAAQRNPSGDLRRQNELLRQVETDLLAPKGLPERAWYKHTIYAPWKRNGYEVVTIPGVNEAIDDKNAVLTASQLIVLTRALDRAADTLSKVPEIASNASIAQ